MNKLYNFYAKHTFLSIHLLLLAISGAFYFVGYIRQTPSLYDVGYGILVFDIFVFLIHRNQHGIYRYMTMNKDVSHLPAKQIHLINTLFLIGFLALCGGLIFLFVHLPYQGIWKALKYLLFSLVKMILQLVLRKKAPAVKPAVQQESAAAVFATDTSVHKASAFAKILERIFDLLTVLILFAAVVWILFAIYKKITSFHGFSETETREFLSPKMEHTKLSRTNGDDKLHFFDRSANGQIRKLYYRTIRRHARQKKIISRSMTPSQLEAFADLPAGENLTQLHNAYEKARYGSGECQKSDVESAKSGASNL